MNEYSVTNPKHPNIVVPLLGWDSNAFSILGRVSRIMKRNDIHDEWEAFHAEATSGDYDNLLRTVMSWFATDSHMNKVVSWFATDEDDDDDEPCWCGCED